jgi:carboxylesterase type B
MLCLLTGIDPTNLVRKSIDMGQPIIVVTLNYRLNIFAFGDCKGETNLAFSDQRAALDFIRLHIRGFGGDPVAHTPSVEFNCWTNHLQDNITLAGESAGAVYVHAHMAMGVPMRQAILQSGSLYLSPPITTVRASSIAATLENHLRLKSPLGGPELTLRTAPVEEILKTLEDTGTVSLYLQAEPSLENWREELGQARRLLIGDCEFEVCCFVHCVCSRADVRHPVCVPPKRG